GKKLSRTPYYIFDPAVIQYTVAGIITYFFVNVSLLPDLGKMPLKKLSVEQMTTASEILNELENVDNHSRPDDVRRLSSQFNALIPPIFRRGCSHLIAGERTLVHKRKILDILTDIAVAQTIQQKIKPLKDSVRTSVSSWLRTFLSGRVQT
ncbi:hypothetical protein CRM22_001092, partial [Opisthorchis felineus]